MAASMQSTAFLALPQGAAPTVSAPVLMVSPPASSDATAAGGETSFMGAAASTLSLSIAALAAGKAVGKLASRRGRVPAVARNLSKMTEKDYEDYMAPYRRDLGFCNGLVGGRHAFGDYNFDPAGFAERVPQAIPFFREAELKHGRICMLAFVGLVVPDIVRIPGPEPCYTANVVDAHNACVGEGLWSQSGPMLQIFFWVFVIEMVSFSKFVEGVTLENAGDYRLGINFLPSDKEGSDRKRLVELKNGRLAMIAFGGAITQAVVSGNGFPWLFSTRPDQHDSAGFGSSVPKVTRSTSVGTTRVAMKNGYKMSKAVPFLPVSPALEGYAGEEDGFDPMGFSLAFDIRWLREAELKHARVSMLAVVGWIATDLGMRVEGEPFQVSTIEAHDVMVKFGSMPQMLVWLGYAEFFGFLAIVNQMEGKTDRQSGDFGIRVLYPKEEAAQYDMQLRELRNGRLAMLAFSGIATIAVLTGKVFPFLDATSDDRQKTTFGQGSSFCGGRQAVGRHSVATKALEASRSLPYLPKPKNIAGWVGEEAEFDPVGFSDWYDMKWLREAELKHGRVTMVATVGYVAQQYIAFPGVDVTPNANDALYTAPPPLLLGLLIACGYIESTSNGGKLTQLDMFEDKNRVPGDLNFGSGMLTNVSEARAYDLKLKELNNGRLAMMAIGGMIHHNFVVNEPLFPIFPEDWKGPQGSWKLNSVVGDVIEGRIGNEMIAPGVGWL